MKTYTKLYDTADAALRAVRTLLVNGTAVEIALRDDRGGNGGIHVDVTGPKPNGQGWSEAK